MGSRVHGFKSSACWKEGFCLLRVETHCVRGVGVAGAQPRGCSSRAWLPPGIVCPAVCWVAPVAPLAPALGLGSAQLSGDSCSGGSSCLGRWGMPCHTGGCAGLLWWYLGLPPLCLCHGAKPPPPCLGSVGAALDDTMTFHRNTCT